MVFYRNKWSHQESPTIIFGVRYTTETLLVISNGHGVTMVLFKTLVVLSKILSRQVMQQHVVTVRYVVTIITTWSDGVWIRVTMALISTSCSCGYFPGHLRANANLP